MSFNRIKMINGIGYIYHVENTWVSGKGSRQKVLGYIGKVAGMGRLIATEILERDGYICQLCKRMDNLTINHKIPLSKGGGNDKDNLWVLCERCNKKKGKKIVQTPTRTIQDFMG